MNPATLLESLNASLQSLEDAVTSGDDAAIDRLRQACQMFTEAVQNLDGPAPRAGSPDASEEILPPASLEPATLAELHSRLIRLTDALLGQQQEIRDALQRMGRSRIALRGYGAIRANTSSQFVTTQG